MTFSRLVKTASLAAGAAALRTHMRARARDGRAAASHPPEGEMVQVNGLRLHAVQYGRGPDLVLIHGASGSSRDFTFGLRDGLMARLAQDFRVIAFDRPGFGHSDALPGAGIALTDQAAHLAAGAALLGAKAPLVLGQSYGGSVALAWGLRHPAAGIIAVSAPALPWPGHLDPWYRATSRPMMRDLLVPLASAWVPDAYVARQITAVFAPNPVPEGYLAHLGADLTLRAGQLWVNVSQINALRDQLVMLEPDWPGYAHPVELVHGTVDAIVPHSIHAEPLAARLPGAELTLLPGIGHMPHHAAPDAVLAAVHRAAARAGLR